LGVKLAYLGFTPAKLPCVVMLMLKKISKVTGNIGDASIVTSLLKKECTIIRDTGLQSG